MVTHPCMIALENSAENILVVCNFGGLVDFGLVLAMIAARGFRDWRTAMLRLISVTGRLWYFAAVTLVVCAAIIYLAPTPTRLWIGQTSLFEWKPCLVAASAYYADDGIEVGARAAASYCEAEDAYDLDRIPEAASESVRQLLHDGLTRDAAIMIAERRAKK